MNQLSVGLLGPVQLAVDGCALPISRRQVRGVLALLAIHRGKPVAAERLIDALWEQELPKRPNHAVQVYVNRLRNMHGAVSQAVRTTSAGYKLDMALAQTDANEFEQLVDRATACGSDNPAAAVRLLDEALELWRGPAFGCFSYAQFATNQAVRLEEIRTMALESKCELQIRLGESRSVIPLLRELASLHPFRDRIVALLAQALKHDGCRVQAAQVLRDHDAFVLRELGVAVQQPQRAIA